MDKLKKFYLRKELKKNYDRKQFPVVPLVQFIPNLVRQSNFNQQSNQLGDQASHELINVYKVPIQDQGKKIFYIFMSDNPSNSDHIFKLDYSQQKQQTQLSNIPSTLDCMSQKNIEWSQEKKYKRNLPNFQQFFSKDQKSIQATRQTQQQLQNQSYETQMNQNGIYIKEEYMQNNKKQNNFQQDNELINNNSVAFQQFSSLYNETNEKYKQQQPYNNKYYYLVNSSNQQTQCLHNYSTENIQQQQSTHKYQFRRSRSRNDNHDYNDDQYINCPSNCSSCKYQKAYHRQHATHQKSSYQQQKRNMRQLSEDIHDNDYKIKKKKKSKSKLSSRSPSMRKQMEQRMKHDKEKKKQKHSPHSNYVILSQDDDFEVLDNDRINIVNKSIVEGVNPSQYQDWNFSFKQEQAQNQLYAQQSQSQGINQFGDNQINQNTNLNRLQNQRHRYFEEKDASQSSEESLLDVYDYKNKYNTQKK